MFERFDPEGVSVFRDPSGVEAGRIVRHALRDRLFEGPERIRGYGAIVWTASDPETRVFWCIEHGGARGALKAARAWLRSRAV